MYIVGVSVPQDNIDPAEPGCLGKLVFDTQKAAWASATVAQFRYGGARLKAYRCKHCDLWHLASKYQEE